MANPEDPDWADEAVEKIIRDMTGRSGMDWSDVDAEIRQEIRQTWAELIRDAAAEPGRED